MTHLPPTHCHQRQRHHHQPPLLRCHCRHYHSDAAVGFAIVPRAHVHTNSKGANRKQEEERTHIRTLSHSAHSGDMASSAARKERSTVQLCGSMAYKSNGNYYLAIFPRRACVYCVNVEFSWRLRAGKQAIPSTLTMPDDEKRITASMVIRTNRLLKREFTMPYGSDRTSTTVPYCLRCALQMETQCNKHNASWFIPHAHKFNAHLNTSSFSAYFCYHIHIRVYGWKSKTTVEYCITNRDEVRTMAHEKDKLNEKRNLDRKIGFKSTPADTSWTKFYASLHHFHTIVVCSWCKFCFNDKNGTKRKEYF